MDFAATWLLPHLLGSGLEDPVPHDAEELAKRAAAAGVMAAREAMIAALAEEIGGEERAQTPPRR